ncbi:L-dopachrome tautomerase-related protein [Capnocytophaga sp.]|uniref:L-dopachrome tautomerase-related protein n=1 Tax=Capnocytophaga sp. TaxID=44737 RepID=UPI0026DD804A|nr:L-dopachrome tautomerase-related protein [Capnocytophaga sp.]MDO5106445.1 L-dopachrome tautomerase-related protein [Capnocytophaga sp.]
MIRITKPLFFSFALSFALPLMAQKSKKQQINIPKPEVFATVDGAVGNIAFTHSGEVVYSYHPFFEPKIRVAKYNAQTQNSEPFPNLEWNTPRLTDDHYLSNVLGIRNDENGIVWMLDMGNRNPVTPKIVGWNTHTNQLERIYYLPETAVVKTSQPNDMLIDTKHQVIVIADEGIANGGDGSTAALIVVDMKTGRTRRLLEGTHSTLPEKKPIVINDKPLTINEKELYVGCDGITADKNFEWLYYAPLNGSKMYRLKISDLLNEKLSQTELNGRVETYSEKPNNGGLSIDEAGNLYLTAMETNSVAMISATDRSVKTVVQDERLLWADGVSFNHSDGYMYVSAAQVHLGAVFNNGKNLAKPPYYIFRFKPIAKGVSFR